MRLTPTVPYRVGLQLTRAYLADGWRVIAAVRDPASMPPLDDLEGEMVVVKLDVGEKEAAKKVYQSILSPVLEC